MQFVHLYLYFVMEFLFLIDTSRRIYPFHYLNRFALLRAKITRSAYGCSIACLMARVIADKRRQVSPVTVSSKNMRDNMAPCRKIQGNEYRYNAIKKTNYCKNCDISLYDWLYSIVTTDPSEKMCSCTWFMSDLSIIRWDYDFSPIWHQSII